MLKKLLAAGGVAVIILLIQNKKEIDYDEFFDYNQDFISSGSRTRSISDGPKRCPRR